MSAPYKTLVYRFGPPIVTLTLARPRACNRVNLAMAMELREVCQRIREEGGARVVVLTGRGKAFSSGRESLFRPRSIGRTNSPLERLELHRSACALAGLEIPVIAAINGDAIDHGMELALACDLRIAARGARLGFTDLSLGRVPWDGGTQRLPRLVGRALALDMLLTSRLLDAEEAARLGLVNVAVEAQDLARTVEKVAMEIASGAPVAARYAKEAVLKGMEMSLDQGLRLEADLNLLLQTTTDRAEGLRSFAEKRNPEFRGE